MRRDGCTIVEELEKRVHLAYTPAASAWEGNSQGLPVYRIEAGPVAPGMYHVTHVDRLNLISQLAEPLASTLRTLPRQGFDERFDQLLHEYMLRIAGNGRFYFSPYTLTKGNYAATMEADSQYDVDRASYRDRSLRAVGTRSTRGTIAYETHDLTFTVVNSFKTTDDVYIDWNRPRDTTGYFTNSEKLFETQRFQWLDTESLSAMISRLSPGQKADPLQLAADARERLRLLNDMTRQIRSWVYQHPPLRADDLFLAAKPGEQNGVRWNYDASGQPTGNPVWGGYVDTARRAESLLATYMLLLNSSIFGRKGTSPADRLLDAERKEMHTLFVIEFYSHARALHDWFDINKVQPNNHGMEAAATLATLARAFRTEFPEAPEWSATAATQLLRMDEGNYLVTYGKEGSGNIASRGDYEKYLRDGIGDGMISEPSPGYTRVVLLTVLEQFQLEALSGGGSILPTLKMMQQKVPLQSRLSAIVDLCSSGADLSEFGDSYPGDIGGQLGLFRNVLRLIDAPAYRNLFMTTADHQQIIDLLARTPRGRMSLYSVLRNWDMARNSGDVTAGRWLRNLGPGERAQAYLPLGTDYAAYRRFILGDAGFMGFRGRQTQRNPEPVQLVFKDGPMGLNCRKKTIELPGHAHYDNLSFTLGGYGRPLIEDPGIGGLYGDRSSWVLSSPAHNAMTVNGYSHARTNADFGYFVPTDTIATTSSGRHQPYGQEVVGWHYGYTNSESADPSVAVTKGTGPGVARTIWTNDGDRYNGANQTFIIVDWSDSRAAKEANFNYEVAFTVRETPEFSVVPQLNDANAVTGLYTTTKPGYFGNVMIQQIESSAGPDPYPATLQTLGQFEAAKAPITHLDDAYWCAHRLTFRQPARPQASFVTLVHTSQDNLYASPTTRAAVPDVVGSRKTYDADGRLVRVDVSLNERGADGKSVVRTLTFRNPFVGLDASYRTRCTPPPPNPTVSPRSAMTGSYLNPLMFKPSPEAIALDDWIAREPVDPDDIWIE